MLRWCRRGLLPRTTDKVHLAVANENGKERSKHLLDTWNQQY